MFTENPLPPLVVDLDGTLVLTDTLHESAIDLVRRNPLHVVKLPLWLTGGKAHLKRRLASCTALDVATLPYNQPLLEWLRQEHRRGRSLVLCTAADHATAQAVADHLQLFSRVLASDGSTNLASENKAEQLVREYGEGGFDYAGNSSADLAVWQRARKSIVVNASPSVEQRAEKIGNVDQRFAAEPPKARDIVRMLRVHQWMKNILLLAPLLAAHQWADSGAWLATLLALVAFSLCASSVYIANDLLDLESDRLHPRKRSRPFASGRVPIWQGVVLAPLLLAASLALALMVGNTFPAWLVLYFLLTCLYSVLLKRLAILDCLTLAALYTLRIVAGAAATEIPLSPWLLAFSSFMFLSLAFVKRYAELQLQAQHGQTKAHGRGYLTTDAPLIQSLGVSAGYATAVVLALYLHSDSVVELYRLPSVLGAAIPVLVFWLSWMWLRAHRGEMHDDPVVFALKDGVSLASGVVFAAILIISTVGLG